MAASIGSDGHVAWDMYLFYEPQTDWKSVAPRPTHWVHQLIDSWAHQAHFRTGDGLRDALQMIMTELQDHP